jgi:hypothetical protein
MERVDPTVTSRWTTVAELLREFADGGLAGVVSGFAVWFRSVFEKRFASDSRRWTIAYAVVVVVGIPLYLGLPATLFDDETLNAPTVVAISVAVIYLNAIGLWALKVWANGAAITKNIRTIGYVAIAAVLIVGLTNVVTDAITIIS